MGIYTVQDEKLIDQKILNDMKLICNIILKYISPTSIFLIGSFGRGEGSVIIENQKVFPIKDYDILIVADKDDLLPISKLQKLNEETNVLLGYNAPSNRNFLFSDFIITIEQTTIENLKHFAHLVAYDIKKGSQLLFGKDIRNEISLEATDIPLSSGAHVLLMKSIGLLGHFSTEYLSHPPTENKKKYLIYECGKTYIEIGTALCLLGSIYEPSYLKRSKNLGINFSRLFPKILEIAPRLPMKIESFTNLKLFPQKEQYENLNSVNLWFQSRDDLLTVLKYYMKSWIGVEPSDISSFPKEYYRNLKNEYYKETIRYFLKTKFGFSYDLPVKILNSFYLKLFSFKYFVRLYKKRGIFHPRVFFESPLLKLYSIVPLLLFSLNKDGSLNEKIFYNVVDELNKIYPIDKSNLTDLDKWEVVKMHLLDAVDLYEGQR